MDDSLIKSVDMGEFEDEPAISKLMSEGLLDKKLFEAGRHALGKDHAPRCAVALGRATAQRIVSDPEIGGSGDAKAFGAFASHIRTWSKGAGALDEDGYRLALHCLMAELAGAQPAWNWSFPRDSGGRILSPPLRRTIAKALLEDPSKPSHLDESLSELGRDPYSNDARFKSNAADPDFVPDVIVERARVNFLRAQLGAGIRCPAASKAAPRV